MHRARLKNLTLFTILVLTLSVIASTVSAQEPPQRPPVNPEWGRVVSLPAPTLSGTASANETNLSWTAVDGAVKYELHSWTITDQWSWVDRNITGTSFNHDELTSDMYYYYWVRAVNSAGNAGSWSDRLDLYVPPDPAATDTPAPTATSTPEPTATHTPAPTFLAAPVVSLDASVDQVVVSWEEVPNADTYDAYWYTVEHGEWVRFAENETGTSVIHTGVVGGRRYHYTVIAENDSGLESDWSDYVDVVIPVPTATPVPPTSTPQPGVTPTAVPVPGKVGGINSTTNYVNRTITLYWSNPNPSAHRYEVVYWENNEWVNLAGDNHTNTNLTHSNIEGGRNYLYHVRGVNSADIAGSWSDRWTVTVAAIATPTPAVPPAQPEDFDVIEGCNDYALSCRPFLWPWSEIWLSWFHSQHAHGNENNDPITYEVVVSKMHPGNPQPVYHTTLTSEYQYVRHTGVVSGDTYVYELKAKNRFSNLSSSAQLRPTLTIKYKPSLVFPKRPWHHQQTIDYFTQGSAELLEHQANCTPRTVRESCKTESLPGTSRGKSVQPTSTPTSP